MTVTTESLRGFLMEVNDEIGSAHPDTRDTKISARLLRDILTELLANREAQPVLYASEETLAYAKEDEKRLVTWSEPMGDAVIPLFTVPPAQTSGVVNLPTEFISDEGVVVRLEQVMAALALVGVKYERRGDACRAAMLAQPVSGGYKFNSPEIPDGWVACSERMPASEGDTQTYVLAGDFKNHYWPNLPNTQVGVYGDWFNDGNPTWDDGDGNDLHLKEVTHWMPLPAAPESVNGA